MIMFFSRWFDYLSIYEDKFKSFELWIGILMKIFWRPRSSIDNPLISGKWFTKCDGNVGMVKLKIVWQN